jgi:acetolactate synthase-1/2/3 large subunit
MVQDRSWHEVNDEKVRSMKLSDYVAEFMADQGIGHVFVVTGGAVAHLIDSVARNKRIEYVCNPHEQACAMAVDGYVRTNQGMGAAMATTGPGAINLLTGIANLYYDSLPALFVTGQVSTSRLMSQAPGVRQLGFQEAPHVELARPLTKYAVLVDDPARIRYELEKAVYLANEGRPGPVLVDICDDVQRADIEPDQLEAFIPPEKPEIDINQLESKVDACLALLAEAKRPVVVLGAAVKIRKCDKEILEFVERLKLPVALTWATMDIMAWENPLNIGGFGISSTRRGNFAIQNSDLVISIGSRLDTHATGTPAGTFARDAKKIVVELDPAELQKFDVFDMKVDVPVQADVKDFISVLTRKGNNTQTQDMAPWLEKIKIWRERFPTVTDDMRNADDFVSPYVFLDALSEKTKGGETIITDCGSNLIQTFQAYKVQENQQVFSALNNSPMGYSLAGAIGASFAKSGERVICIIGDGGLQVNLQELLTVVRYQLPIVIFLFNNHGYGIIQQTQEDWLDGRHHASSPDSGLADPDYLAIAEAMGLPCIDVHNHQEMDAKVDQALSTKGPVLCQLRFSPDQRIHPMLKAGRPIEDAMPLIDRETFMDNMLVEPLDVSKRVD